MICLVTLEQVHDPAPKWVGNVTGRQVEIYAEGESHMQCEVYAAKAAEIALGGTWESLACYQLDRDRVPDIPEGQGIVGGRLHLRAGLWRPRRSWSRSSGTTSARAPSATSPRRSATDVTYATS